MGALLAETKQRIGLCLDCNYELQGLPVARCPECGRVFDPEDASTFNPGRAIPSWAGFVLGPISWPVYLVMLLGMGEMVWRARLPGGHFLWRSPVMVGWLVVAGIWLVWPLVRRVVLAGFGWPGRAIRPMGRAFWIVPVMAVGMVAGVCGQVPRRVGFRVSLPAMNRLAAEVRATPTLPHGNRWVGVYPAKNIHAISGGVKFTAQDDNTAFKAGFVYLPKLDPRNRSFHSYQYMGAGWWSWREEG